MPSQPFDRISDEDKTVKLNIHRGLQFTIKAVSDFGASDCMLRAQMYRPAIFFAFEFAQKMIKAAIANYTDEKTFNVFYLEENLNKLSAIIAEKIADKHVVKHLLKVASELEKISVGTRADSMCFIQIVQKRRSRKCRVTVAPNLWNLHRPAEGETRGGVSVENSEPPRPQCRSQD